MLQIFHRSERIPFTQGHEAASFAQGSSSYWTAVLHMRRLELSETGVQLRTHFGDAAGEPAADHEVRHGGIHEALLLFNQHKELPCRLGRLILETKHTQGADLLPKMRSGRLYFSATGHLRLHLFQDLARGCRLPQIVVHPRERSVRYYLQKADRLTPANPFEYLLTARQGALPAPGQPVQLNERDQRDAGK